MKLLDRKELLTTFGKVVKQRRRELELSQEQFAYKADLHRSYISSLERGGRNVSIYNFFRIAYALEVSPEELMEKISKKLYEDFGEGNGD